MEMGISNCLFPIALIDPDLRYVDPHDYKNLDYATKLKIGVECKRNPWYFFRECVRVPPVAGEEDVMLSANRANISVFWCLLNSLDYYLQQIRQTGKSLNGDVFSNWYNIFGTKNTRSTLFTKGDLVKENIDRLKKIRNRLPKYLVSLVAKDTDNQGEFTNMVNANRLVAVRAQKDPEMANNAGRGITTPMNLFDEFPFLKNIHVTFPAAAGGMGAARKAALRQGIPTATLISSTPGMLDTEEGEYAHDILMSGMPWTETLFDSKNRDELVETVKAGCSSEAPLINGSFTHRMLGFTDEELRVMIANTRSANRDAIKRDYLLQWSTGGMESPLDREILEKIAKSKTHPLYTEKFDKEKYVCRWYIPKDEVVAGIPDRQIVLGLDASEIIGRDNIAGCMIDIETLEIVGAFTVNESNLQLFSGWLTKLMIRHKGITLIPEKKSIWQAIMDYLLIHLSLAKIDPGRRVFSRIVDEKNASDSDYRAYQEFCKYNGRPEHYDQYRKYFGFNTDEGSRGMLYGPVLQETAKRVCNVVRDSMLASEISGLVTKNNRVDHRSGRHDDHVMAWLMANWLLNYGRNLEHYGIDQNRVKRKVYQVESEMSWKEEKRKSEAIEIREEMEELVEQMNKTNDEWKLARLESRLAVLYTRLGEEDDSEIESLDAAIKAAKDRRTRMKTRTRLRAGASQSQAERRSQELYGAVQSGLRYR